MGVIYRGYDQFAVDIRRWLRHLPPISAVAGVPRSGVFAAAVIATERHIPLVSIESLSSGASGRPGNSRPLREIDGPVLVVDDTAWQGCTIRAVNSALPDFRSGVLLAAVYAHPRTHRVLDLWGYAITDARHTFAWNLFREINAGKLATDLDGVLADESPGAPAGDDADPLVPTTRQIHAVITGRPERHRAATERWFRRRAIDVRHLHMLPDNQATKFENIVRFKGSVFRRLHSSGRVAAFVESCPRQAKWIAEATGLPVISYAEQLAYNQTELKPSWTT